MEMHFIDIPVYTIMLIGRWPNDAFVCYIRKQIKQFSKHIAKQMLHLTWSPTTTPGSATIKTIPRQDAILDATILDGCSYRFSPSWTDQSMMQKQLMEESLSHQLLKVSGEGRVEITLYSKTNLPLCTFCASPSNSRIKEAFGFEVASLNGHRQRRERARTGRQKK
jgi:hypothetical protein